MLTNGHVHAIAQRIAAAAHSPLKAIVFGSYGRGDATEDADLDLLVVRTRRQPGYRASRRRRVAAHADAAGDAGN